MLMIAITNLNRGIIFSPLDIRLTNRGGVGIGGLLKAKLKKGEEIIDVRPYEQQDEEIIS